MLFTEQNLPFDLGCLRTSSKQHLYTSTFFLYIANIWFNKILYRLHTPFFRFRELICSVCCIVYADTATTGVSCAAPIASRYPSRRRIVSIIRGKIVGLTGQRSSQQSLKEIDLMRKIELLNNDEVICCSYRRKYHEWNMLPLCREHRMSTFLLV